MGILFKKVSSNIHDILRSFDYSIDLYDKYGNKVYDSERAFFFFAKPDNIMVSIVDDGDDSAVNVNLSTGFDIKENSGLLDRLKTLATRYNLVYNLKTFNKKLTPKDFADFVIMSPINEAMYGTTRSSYQKFPGAKLIIRHTKPIDELLIGARGRNIRSIYIEDGEGQRLKFPVPVLAGARAMCRHIAEGGSYFDEVGEQIVSLSEEHQSLRSVYRYLRRNNPELNEEKTKLTNVAYERLHEIKKLLKDMLKPKTYDDAKEVLIEDGAEITEEELNIKAEEIMSLLNVTEGDETMDLGIKSLAKRTLGEERKPKITFEVTPAIQSLAERLEQAYNYTAAGAEPLDPKDVTHFEEFLVQAERLVTSKVVKKSVSKPGEKAIQATDPTMRKYQDYFFAFSTFAQQLGPEDDIISILSARIAHQFDKLLNGDRPEFELRGPEYKNAVELVAMGMRQARTNPVESVSETVNESAISEIKKLDSWFDSFSFNSILSEQAKAMKKEEAKKIAEAYRAKKKVVEGIKKRKQLEEKLLNEKRSHLTNAAYDIVKNKDDDFKVREICEGLTASEVDFVMGIVNDTWSDSVTRKVRKLVTEHVNPTTKKQLNEKAEFKTKFNKKSKLDESIKYLTVLSGQKGLYEGKELTLADAKKELSELGIVLKRDPNGDEFVVNYKGGEEDTAYYTDDLQDALDTGKKMSKDQVNESEFTYSNDKFSVGDTAIVLGNVRFSGHTGEVVSISPSGQYIDVKFEDGTVASYHESDLQNFDTEDDDFHDVEVEEHVDSEPYLRPWREQGFKIYKSSKEDSGGWMFEVEGDGIEGTIYEPTVGVYQVEGMRETFDSFDEAMDALLGNVVESNLSPDGRGRYIVTYIKGTEIGNDRFETELDQKRFAADLKRKGYHVELSTDQLGSYL